MTLACPSLKFDYLGKEIPDVFLARAQTFRGKLELLLIFAGCWYGFDKSADYPFVIVAIAFCTFAPQYRWHVLAVATLSVFLINPFWFNSALPETVAKQENIADQINYKYLHCGVAVFFFALCATLIACKRRYGLVLGIRRPILVLLSLYSSLVILASQHVLHGVPQVVLWSFIAMFGGYFWFLGYAMIDGNSKATPVFVQLGAFHPFWGSSTTPIGKGSANLRNVEVKDKAELAAVQIKGVRLLVFCTILRAVLIGFQSLVHGYLGVPDFENVLAQQTMGALPSRDICWWSLLSSFVETVMTMAITGNSIVACGRMAGFNLLRNTYKPLQARTIAQFWNSYYYYFKELLVDFFFYPVFLRYFKEHRKLRIAFATFMAACVGNAIFHFMRDIIMVVEKGLVSAITDFGTYVFYCFLLATGIVISQLSSRPIASGGLFKKAILPTSGVMAFFCFVSIFDKAGDMRLPLSAAWSFALHLHTTLHLKQH